MQIETRSIASIAEEWDQLAGEIGATPFARPGWIDAWWRAFGGGSLRALVARTGAHLTGIVPLVRDGAVFRSPSNSETPIFEFLVKSGDVAEQLATTILSAGARRLDLSFLPSDDAGFHALRDEAHARAFRTITQPVLLSPYVSLHGSWSDYQAKLGAKLKSEIRRRRRRLEELGDLSLKVTDGSERLDDLLSEGFRVEQSGWKGDYGTAINSNPRRHQFYRDVARWAGERGWLRLAFLRLDGRTIAFDLCLEANSVHFLLKTGYDHDFKKFGPGMILRSMMLERAFSEPIDSYEFLGTVVGDNNRWKLDWTWHHHTRLRFQAFAASPTALAAWSASRFGPVLSRGARALARTALGSSGRGFVKRGRRILRDGFRQ
jgi:CelD/BcsL family acetyltransferase involved in cellulose biosynthesis